MGLALEESKFSSLFSDAQSEGHFSSVFGNRYDKGNLSPNQLIGWTRGDC